MLTMESWESALKISQVLVANGQELLPTRLLVAHPVDASAAAEQPSRGHFLLTRWTVHTLVAERSASGAPSI